MPKTLIVTPTYNEKENLPRFIEAVRPAFPEADMMIVDDNSPDGTGAIADAIAEHCFLHIDGNSTNLNLQSKDGTTTVAATDTTLDYTAGSAVANRVHLLIDGRNLASLRIFINGVRALAGTTFRLDNAASTLFLLAHLEKTSAATVFEVDVDLLRLWTSQQ